MSREKKKRNLRRFYAIKREGSLVTLPRRSRSGEKGGFFESGKGSSTIREEMFDEKQYSQLSTGRGEILRTENSTGSHGGKISK